MTDRLSMKEGFIPFCIAMTGFTASLSIPHTLLPSSTYFFLFFITAGLYLYH